MPSRVVGAAGAQAVLTPVIYEIILLLLLRGRLYFVQTV